MEEIIRGKKEEKRDVKTKISVRKKRLVEYGNKTGKKKGKI